jgi:hypothetical protein
MSGSKPQERYGYPGRQSLEVVFLLTTPAAGPASGASEMGIFRRKVPNHYIPIHQDNVRKKEWVIILEAGTIIGPSTEKLRVAKATMEKKIVRKYNIFLRKKHFLVLEDYDPQIHAMYFCPQLYRSGTDGNLVALEGEEIGKLLARSLQDGVAVKRPWYNPSTKLKNQPIISADAEARFDSLVVDAPTLKE